MGTNYYTKPEACSHCGNQPQGRHLGKSSAGWHFSLHVYPNEGIHTLPDLMDAIGDSVIVDEYGGELTRKEFLAVVMVRFRHPEHAMSAEWLRENHAEPGFMGLARHQIDHLCIGHSDGPWDYLAGDFS